MVLIIPEQRHVEELVMQLQPHPRAEAHRAAVFRHICKMVRHVAAVQAEATGDECDIQVHRFGSVPLKTYLPHGDLDVTAFAADDKWLQKVGLIRPCPRGAEISLPSHFPFTQL